MAEEPLREGKTTDPSLDSGSGDRSDRVLADVLPAKVQEAIKQIPDKQMQAELSVALSRTTFGFGPDPQMAKVMAQAEMHEETCRLEGYKVSQQTRDKQNERDHDYRNRKLEREFWMSMLVLVTALAGAGTGIYFIASGNTIVGSNLLTGSIGIILYLLKGPSGMIKG